ncbi:MAG: hypothetical protein LBQ54_02255 [Planctomycetaceae bacterium]|jgi:hypothetical protein|nr:hypothetical protein [Planctomycetaceae bacterium]
MMNFNFVPRIAEVDCHEWDLAEGEKIYVKEPNAGEFALFEHLTGMLHFVGTNDAERRKIYAKIAVLLCCDQNGKLKFSEEQIPLIAQGNSKPLRRIALKVSDLSMLDEQEEKELEKN